MLFKLEEGHPEIQFCHGNADGASSEGLLTGAARMARPLMAYLHPSLLNEFSFLLSGPWIGFLEIWGFLLER
jgi:hypothetical protein